MGGNGYGGPFFCMLEIIEEKVLLWPDSRVCFSPSPERAGAAVFHI